ncbi:MAG TPA: AraC family ligand binding domain-containing protein [Burkholderiaceae bacterium]|nr:AraC family ligand binding domain-containing protein [Burkholderiaceae bacterium]
MDATAFTRELAELGFDEVLTRQWRPNQFVDTHSHPFEVRALVLEGELTLGCGGQSVTYGSGEIFTLNAHEPHTEQYGPQGATYLVGRKRVA